MDHWTEIRHLSKMENLSQREISRRHGISRKTVAKALRDGKPPVSAGTRRVEGWPLRSSYPGIAGASSVEKRQWLLSGLSVVNPQLCSAIRSPASGQRWVSLTRLTGFYSYLGNRPSSTFGFQRQWLRNRAEAPDGDLGGLLVKVPNSNHAAIAPMLRNLGRDEHHVGTIGRFTAATALG